MPTKAFHTATGEGNAKDGNTPATATSCQITSAPSSTSTVIHCGASFRRTLRPGRAEGGGAETFMF